MIFFSSIMCCRFKQATLILPCATKILLKSFRIHSDLKKEEKLTKIITWPTPKLTISRSTS